ncbi:MAG: ABC transporter substrate-binding protein [Corynebacterium marinum]|uniref:ABC transporter substrate-binding protein n=1 Tax=Corynebacterium marinum TaxID=349751 RepID=A0A847HES6_9CORY|nr:ABC transporter substrate-binding protein [Corynebacterium marinum]
MTTKNRVLAGVTALLSTLVLSSCTSALSQPAAETAADAGGTIRIGAAQDLNPQAFYSGLVTHTGLVYDTLTSYRPDNLEPQPRLATSWTVAEDGRTVTLNLREDVTFHDGRPFTSQDVEFSLVNYSDPAYAGQLFRVAQAITSYDSSDPHRITLQLAHPVNNLFDLFENVPVIDRNTVEQLRAGEHYNGTGPFRFEEWKPGAHTSYEANPDYWDGAPKVDGVEVAVVPDPQTQVSQLRAGQLDLISAQPRDVEALGDDPAFNVVSLEGTSNVTYIGANVTAPGLEDPRLREAISLAVDRERILEEVYRGRARASSLPWPDYSPAHDPAAELPSRDLAAAEALVEDVGEIPEIPLTIPSGSLTYSSVAEIVADNLAEIGVRTRIEPLDPAANLSHLINGTYPGLWIYGHTFAQYNPSTLVIAAFPFNSEKNASNFRDEGYSRHAAESWRTSDPDSPEARDAYAALNRDLLDHNFLIELSVVDTELLTAGSLHDVKWNKRGLYDLSDAYFTG